MTTAFWYDADGNELPTPEGAVTGEIHEEDGTRTYVDFRPPAEGEDPAPSAVMTGAGEAVDPENSDWLKTSWDIYLPGEDEPVNSLEGLMTALGLSMLPLAEQRKRLGGILALPIWDVAPQPVKDEAYAFLVATRQE